MGEKLGDMERSLGSDIDSSVGDILAAGLTVYPQQCHNMYVQFSGIAIFRQTAPMILLESLAPMLRFGPKVVVIFGPFRVKYLIENTRHSRLSSSELCFCMTHRIIAARGVTLILHFSD